MDVNHECLGGETSGSQSATLLGGQGATRNVTARGGGGHVGDGGKGGRQVPPAKRACRLYTAVCSHKGALIPLQAQKAMQTKVPEMCVIAHAKVHFIANARKQSAFNPPPSKKTQRPTLTKPRVVPWGGRCTVEAHAPETSTVPARYSKKKTKFWPRLSFSREGKGYRRIACRIWCSARHKVPCFPILS